MDISNIPRYNWTVDETNGDITGKENFCLAHQIQQPIPKLQILNFHEFFSTNDRLFLIKKKQFKITKQDL